MNELSIGKSSYYKLQGDMLENDSKAKSPGPKDAAIIDKMFETYRKITQDLDVCVFFTLTNNRNLLWLNSSIMTPTDCQ